MQVNCDKEAFELYNDYAIHNGFSVRRGTFRRLKGDIIRARTFLCSKAGLRENSDPLEEKKVDRLDTRTDCKARVVFTVTDGVWEITDLNLEHNHELASKEERQFLRSGRKMQPAQAGVIDSMVDAGIRPTQTYDYMANEHGGADKVGFTRRDCHNYLHSKKKILIKAGDGQSVLNHFKKRQVEDPMFFSSEQVNEKNRMTNFFWRDGRSRLDYDCFGDVIMFDTTYRTNKYNMVCAPFVGMNHHWSNVLFGCAFLLDETTESFIWLFETFLESMGGKQPKIIFTDQCQAMSNAIAMVFPESRHRLCLWHISTKAAQKLGNHYADPDIKSLLNKCFFSCDNVTEFEETWNRLIQKPNLAENKWLKSLYEIKEKWCAAFTSDIFSAKAQSTQRSESTNNVFHKISTKTLTLTEFVCHYENQSKKMRGKEQLEDFRCKQGQSNQAPTFISSHGSFQLTHPHSNISGQHNQAMNFISPHGSSQAPQNHTYFTSSAHPANINIYNQTPAISSGFDNQPTSFTSLLQSSDHMLYLSQTSTSSGAEPLYPWFGTPPPK